MPTISKGWGACNSDNPRNARTRASILVESANTRVLIDTSPDFRTQCLTNNIKALDAVLFTHTHADHTNGLDEVREINRVIDGPLNIWADVETMKDLETRFGYAFEGIKPGQPFFRPWLIPNIIDPPQPFCVGDMEIKPFIQDHGVMDTLGFRTGNFAYSTDVIRLPDTAKASLQNLDLWIIGALTNNNAHQTHVTLDKALDWIAELKPKRAIITHMGPDLDYDAVLEKCPAGVTPAYDGMVLRV